MHANSTWDLFGPHFKIRFNIKSGFGASGEILGHLKTLCIQIPSASAENHHLLNRAASRSPAIPAAVTEGYLPATVSLALGRLEYPSRGSLLESERSLLEHTA